MARISPTMKTALEVIAAAGGTFILNGGFWTPPGHVGPRRVVGTGTVEALVRSGELEVTRRANGIAVEVRLPGAEVACG